MYGYIIYREIEGMCSSDLEEGNLQNLASMHMLYWVSRNCVEKGIDV